MSIQIGQTRNSFSIRSAAKIKLGIKICFKICLGTFLLVGRRSCLCNNASETANGGKHQNFQHCLLVQVGKRRIIIIFKCLCNNACLISGSSRAYDGGIYLYKCKLWMCNTHLYWWGKKPETTFWTLEYFISNIPYHSWTGFSKTSDLILPIFAAWTPRHSAICLTRWCLQKMGPPPTDSG